MDQYIKIDSLLSKLRERDLCLCVTEYDIRSLPREDVAPVRRGEWDVEVGMNFSRERICTACEKRIKSNFWNFCPNCGSANV